MYLKPYRPEAPGILPIVRELRESGASDKSLLTVVVADDHLVILEELIKILHSQKDIKVVATATDGETVSKLYNQFLPHVLILDLRLPKKDGLQVLSELMASGSSEPRVIIITTFDSEEAIFRVKYKGHP